MQSLNRWYGTHAYDGPARRRLQEDTLTRAEQSGLGMATPEGCDPVVVQRVDSDGAVVTWRGQQLTGVPKRSLRIPGSGERGLRHG